jgi:hypothetical protein
VVLKGKKVLYNQNLKGYFSKTEQEKAWQQVVEEIKCSG